MARFPLRAMPTVTDRIRRWLLSSATEALVSSAACGADLIALKLAAEIGIRTRVILPFPPDLFRESSVEDRPGNWGQPFDEAVERARRGADLVVLSGAGEGSGAYAAANRAILDEASTLAAKLGCRREAAIVWDGHSRGHGDLTEAFGRLARQRGFAVTEIPTLDPAAPSRSHPMT